MGNVLEVGLKDSSLTLRNSKKDYPQRLNDSEMINFNRVMESKNHLLLLTGLLFGLLIYACQETSLQNAGVFPEGNEKEIYALANNWYPPDLCRFYCAGGCEVGGAKCYIDGGWDDYFVCSCEGECHMVFVYDDVEVYPGDPGYDDLWNHIHDRDLMYESVQNYLTQELGLENYTLEEGFLFTHPETENYAFRYHVRLEDDSLYSVMAIKGGGEGDVCNFDCMGTCPDPIYIWGISCIETYFPQTNTMMCWCDEDVCFENFSCE
jgi:hypothetical protein